MLRKFFRLLDIGLKAIMAIFLFAMMAITFVDVLGRYVFSLPVPGGFEIVQYLMALVVFASLPLTTAADSHLSVTLIPPRPTGAVGFIHRFIVRALSVITLALIAWRMTDQAIQLDRARQISGFLEIPLAPIAWVMAALAALAFLVLLAKVSMPAAGLPAEPETPRGFE